MTISIKYKLAAVALSLGAVAATAQEIAPSHPSLPDGITAEKYYNGGAVSGSETQALIDRFDALDFEIFSNQQWDRVHESHDDDIIVTWPDGHSTVGIDTHIDDLKNLFVFAPDLKIESHPVRIGSDDWTAVIGVMTGTFTEPMPIGGGNFIEPTNKAFSIQMATVAFWQDERMIHEWLFWDNDTFYRQLGLKD